MVIKSNLVIQTAFLGDLILSIPTFKKIKEIYPEDSLIVACKEGIGEFLLKEKLVDEIIEIKKSDSRSYGEALIYLKKFQFRNIFCIHRSIRSQLFAAQIKADKKIGFSSFFNVLPGFWIFNTLVPYVQNNPEVIRQIKILEPIDQKTFKELKDNDFSNLNESPLLKVPDFFSFKNEFNTKKKNVHNLKIAIFPGSVWATKKWTTAGYTELCKLLIQNKYEVHLLGGPSEKNLCEEIASKAAGAQVIAGSLSITETINQLVDYDVVVSNDSAPTHMAAYKDVPVITIFGPTTLSQGFRPWSNKALVVENKSLDCRPCGKHGHHQCPLGHHNCMKLIEAQEVFKKVQDVLNSFKNPTVIQQ